MTDYFGAIVTRHRHETEDSKIMIHKHFLAWTARCLLPLNLGGRSCLSEESLTESIRLWLWSQRNCKRNMRYKLRYRMLPLAFLVKLFASSLRIFLQSSSHLSTSPWGKRTRMDALTWMAFGWIPRVLLIAIFSSDNHGYCLTAHSSRSCLG